MPHINFRVEDAPNGLVTYGSLWRYPRTPDDDPVIELLAVRAGEPTPKTLEPGWYVYYFAFTDRGHDKSFDLIMAYADGPAPAPTRESFSTDLPYGRVFTFLV